MSRGNSRIAATGLVAALLIAANALAERPSQPKDEAPLVVEGVVREVFRSTRETNIDSVVQVEVASSSVGKTARNTGRLVLPAPGESIYIHVFERRPDAPKVPSAGGHHATPPERSTIKAYLYPRRQGGWEGAYPDWFDITSRELAAKGDADPEPMAGDASATAPKPPPVEPHSPRIIGVKVESVHEGKVQGVRVDKLMPGGPAAKAGLEVGDIITEVDGQPTTTTAQLNETVRRGGATLTLTVVDKNSGKPVPVKVAMNAAEPDGASGAKPDTNSGSKTPLGLSVDFDIVAGTSGLKILQVQPGSLAQRAGLEKGQVVIDANDIIALNGNQLDEIVKKSGRVLKLKVFDPTTRKKTVVEIPLDRP